MSKFFGYEARGYKYERDKNGNPVRLVKLGGPKIGNVKNDPYMYGAIMRQNPDLLQAERVYFSTWGL